MSFTPSFLRVVPHRPQRLHLLERCWTLLWDPGNKTGLDLGEARDGAWAGPTTRTSPRDARTCAHIHTHNTHTQKLTSKLLSTIHKPLYSLRPRPSQIMYSETQLGDASAFSCVFLTLVLRSRSYDLHLVLLQ